MAGLPATCEAAVVGGGIAGLVAAWELRDRDVVLLESEGRVGGRIESEPCGDYWLNLGAHLFPASTTYLGRLVDRVGLESAEVRGTVTAVSMNGRTIAKGPLESYPLRLKLPLAARLSLVRLGLRLRRDLASATGEARTRYARMSFAEYLGHLHPEVRALMDAATNRVATGPDDLAADAGLGLFRFAGTFGDPAGLAHRRNIVGGSGRLPAALARSLGERVFTDARVTEIRQDADGVEVTVERDGHEHNVRAKAAVIATPAPTTRQIVAGLPAEVDDALGRVVYGPYVVGALATSERARMPWDDVYAMVTPKRSFNMFFNTASVTRRPGVRRPGGTIMVYGGGDRARALMHRTDAEVQATFLADLDGIFPQASVLVDQVRIKRWTHGIPYARARNPVRLQVLQQAVGRVCLAGDYLAGFADMEAAAETGRNAARQVMTTIDRNAAATPAPRPS